MRLATVRTSTGTRGTVVTNGRHVDFAATDASLPNSVRGLIAAGAGAMQAASAAAASTKAAVLDPERLAPPIPDPRKILCIGLNYRDHALENKRTLPTEPVLFGKFPNTLIGHNDTIRLPKVSQKVDFEAELVVVIGRTGRDIPTAEAMSYVAGYTIGHDVSARDWQFKGEEKQWIIGKSFDTFAPLGPHIVTVDEIPDPHQLGIRLKLNGQVMQDGNTRDLIFTIPDLIVYLSQVMTLEPGDLLFTGTPAGVGVARKPQVFLQAGDVVEIEIDGLGMLLNAAKAS